MTALACHAAGPLPGRESGTLRVIRVIAAKELRDALGNRWFILYSLAFGVLAVALSFVSLASAGAYGFAGFGKTAAGLLNLIMLIVPLLGITTGAGNIAGERERGMLVYLLAQPVSRIEVLIGKFLGLSAALIASLLLGFGASAALLAWRAGGAGAGAFAVLAAYTCLLALAMLSVGLFISTLARRSGIGVGIGVFVWLALAFISDLGLMAGTLVFRLRVEQMFALAIVNPLQAFKMSVLGSLHASLDVLGPAGLYASQTYGRALPLMLLGVLLAWIVLPLAGAAVIFGRRSPL
jgi:Cu-processing system permease protein